MRAVSGTVQLVVDRLRESIEVKQSMLENIDLLDLIDEAAQVCIRSVAGGGKILLFGNGGSAADAQHIAAELVGRYLRNRKALPAIALTTNTSNITAVGNDYSYDEIFSRQVEAIGCPGDVAIGISTSGNSRNVIQALALARKNRMTTIGLTGSPGGEMRKQVEYCMCVPSDSTPRIQEAHIWFGHTLCEIIEDSFADERNFS